MESSISPIPTPGLRGWGSCSEQYSKVPTTALDWVESRLFEVEGEGCAVGGVGRLYSSGEGTWVSRGRIRLSMAPLLFAM